VQWIRTTRNDRLRQAVSTVRAMQTGMWTALLESRGEPVYDADRITGSLNNIRQYEAGWDRYFERIGVSPFTITYEQIDADYQGTMAAVFDYLGVHAAVPPRQITRQADALNDEWVARYLADHPGFEA
jgi:LPS sulfotransferase NodH